MSVCIPTVITLCSAHPLLAHEHAPVFSRSLTISGAGTGDVLICYSRDAFTAFTTNQHWTTDFAKTPAGLHKHMIIVEGHIRVCALEWVCIYVSEIRRCLPAFVSVISSLDRCLRKGSKFTWGTTVPLREVCVCVCRYCRYSTYICGSLTASMCVSVEVCLCNCSVCAGTGTWVCVCVCVCVYAKGVR